MNTTRRIASILLVVFAVIGVPVARGAVPAAKPKPVAATLATTYSMTMGDMLAITVGMLLNGMKPIDMPILVSYERDEKLLEIALLGQRNTVDGAKEMIEEFLQKGQPIVNAVAEQYGVTLSDSQVRIYYWNRLDGYKEIVRREQGHYVVD